MMFIRNICHGYTLLLGISLALSAFTHLWNPLGFPSVYVDEGHYMRRAMQVLKGLGPQDHYYPYDHPYFGQLFLAGVFKVIGYPNSLLSPSPSSSYSSSSSSSSSVNVLHSIEMLYLVPRVLMGILAVVDTFLIYKISERRYNRNVAIIASILFAVMPLSWLMRRILLDTILMPFLLSSILFAVYIRGYSKNGDHSSSSSSWWSKRKNNNITLTLLSGIFLGLAIFTKIPAFTMIPLVGYIIFYENNKKNLQQTITKYFSNNKRFRINNYYLGDIIFGLNNKNLKILALWFIPIILIPSIWPIYALYNGQLNGWLQGVISEENRHDRPLLDSIITDLKIDPVFLLIGIAAVVYAFLKRDMLIVLWVIPFLIFLYIIGHVYPFHLIPLLPVLCIASAKLIESISKTIGKKSIQRLLLLFAMIFGIGEFGLISSYILVTTNVNFSYFKAYAAFVQHLPNHINNQNNSSKDKVTVIGPHWIWSYLWIPKYVFDKDYYYIFVNPGTQSSVYKQPLKTHKVLFITDDSGPLISKNDTKTFSKQIQTLYYNNTKILATIDNNNTIYNVHNYPYNGMITSTGIGRIEIKLNY